jgi:hypothetical protein
MILVIMRHFKSRGKMASLEIHHHEDAKRWNLGAKTRVCKMRMTFDNSQRLMKKLALQKIG